MSEDIKGFKHDPKVWTVEHKQVIEGACVFCQAPYVGEQIEVTTPTAVVQLCPECWVEFKEEYPEAKVAKQVAEVTGYKAPDSVVKE